MSAIVPEPALPPPLKERFSTLAFYWRNVIRPQPLASGTIFCLMVASSFLEMATVGLAVPILDALTDPSRIGQRRSLVLLTNLLARAGVPTGSSVVIFALLLLACTLFIMHGGLLLLHQYATASIAVKYRRQTKRTLLERFLKAPFEEVAKQARGTIVHHINYPAEGIHLSIVNLGNFFSGILDCVVMVGMMMYFSWQTTLIIGLLAVAGVEGWRRFADWRSAAHGRTIYRLRAEQAKIEADAIDGLRVVKAHGLEDRLVAREEASLTAEVRPTLRLTFFRYAPTLVNEIIACSIMLGLGAVTFLYPALGLRFSMLVTFLLALRRIAPAMARVNAASVELNRFRPSLEMMREVLYRMPQERTGRERLHRVERIELRDVSCAYASRPEQTVLQGVSMRMPRGAITAIVGPSGAGKSTVANLLLGLYEPAGGSIRANGVELRQLDLAAWRRGIGYVSQDLFVFNDTMRENITLGEPTTPAWLAETARATQLHEFIDTLPQGYDTIVGDRGMRLSGGQCQRLALARALFRRPQVLILDEATSALDGLTERAVYQAIEALQEDAVILVITHRLSTMLNADYIYVMQQGRIVEEGSYQALLDRQGPFSRMAQIAPAAAAMTGAAGTGGGA